MLLFRGGLASLLCLLPWCQLHAKMSAQVPAAVTVKATAGPADLPVYDKEAVVILEHTAVVRFTADGLGERLETMRAKIKSDAAVRALGVITIPYASSNERVELVYLRVRKADGTVVATSDQDAQDMPSAVTRTAPMYSDTREKQIPVKSLSTGDILEYQVKIVKTTAEAPGQFWYAQNFLLGNVVLAETIELHVPQKKYVQVASPLYRPEKREEGTETVYVWHYSQPSPTPTTEAEKKAYLKKLQEQAKKPAIMATTFHSWVEVGQWYQGLSQDRVVVTPAVRTKADEVVHGIQKDDDRIAAIYSYVSTQIRYISVSFGVGRYQPHTADTVLANQYGDCKDKHTLLAAMLLAEGIQASPVLIGSAVKLDPDVPTPAQFDHVITLVQQGKEQIWLDATPEVAPYRVLMQPLRDKQALLIPTGAPARLEKTPADLPFPAYYNLTAKGTLDSAGTLKGHVDATMRGDAEVLFRAGLHETARPQWADLFQNVSYAQGFAGTVSNVDATLPEKTGEPFHYSYDYERKEFSDWANHRIMPLLPPVDLMAAGDEKPDEPIELGSPGSEKYLSTITLPEGYSAQLPEPVKVSSDIADYSSTYSLKGQELVTERTLSLKASKVPLSEWEAYKTFQKKVTDDYQQMIQLYTGDQKQEAKDAGSPEAQRLVQQAFDEIRDHELGKAAETLDAAEHANPDQWGLWAGRGYLEQQKRNVEPALRNYHMEIKLHPHNKGAFDALIWTELNLGRKEQVIPTLQKMLVAFPGDAAVEERLGGALMAKDDYARALPILTQAVKDAPTNKHYAVYLGASQIKAGMRADGETTLKTAIGGSDDASLLNDGSYELADAGLALPLADEVCRKSLELQEKESQAIEVDKVNAKDFSTVNLLVHTWDTMGWILFREGKLEPAEAYLSAAWTLSQENTVGSHLGQVYEAQGKKQEALKIYEEALRSQAPGTSEREGKVMKERALKLANGQALEHGQRETEELLKLRTIELPEFVKEYSSADFNLLWSGGSLDNVVFDKGDEKLRPAVALLKKASPVLAVPPDSKAKILRHGIMACSEITKSCQMVLLYPSDAVTAATAD